MKLIYIKTSETSEYNIIISNVLKRGNYNIMDKIIESKEIRHRTMLLFCDEILIFLGNWAERESVYFIKH